MTLLAADGHTHLNQATLPLTSYSVTWFMEGRKLLQHAHDLHRVRAKLVCLVCEAHGGVHDVRVVVERNAHRAFVACPHRPRGGAVLLDRSLEIQPLLQALGWGLRCSACGDALRGDNDPEATTSVHVTCPCTSRDYQIAVA